MVIDLAALPDERAASHPRAPCLADGRQDLDNTGFAAEVRRMSGALAWTTNPTPRDWTATSSARCWSPPGCPVTGMSARSTPFDLRGPFRLSKMSCHA